jgi:hypothetical protein
MSRLRGTDAADGGLEAYYVPGVFLLLGGAVAAAGVLMRSWRR